MKRLHFSITPIFILLWAMGCSQSDRPPIGEVSGTVLNGGKPVVGALIEFFPQSGRPSMGNTDSSGKYTLYYAFKEPGAKIGLHKVKLSSGQTAPDPSVGDAPPKPMPKPKNGEEGLTLGDNIEVKAGTNTIDFDVANIKN